MRFTKYEPRASRSGVRKSLRAVKGRAFAVPPLSDDRCEWHANWAATMIDSIVAARHFVIRIAMVTCPPTLVQG
jgi:hypothetical protein